MHPSQEGSPMQLNDRGLNGKWCHVHMARHGELCSSSGLGGGLCQDIKI